MVLCVLFQNIVLAYQTEHILQITVWVRKRTQHLFTHVATHLRFCWIGPTYLSKVTFFEDNTEPQSSFIQTPFPLHFSVPRKKHWTKNDRNSFKWCAVEGRKLPSDTVNQVHDKWSFECCFYWKYRCWRWGKDKQANKSKEHTDLEPCFPVVFIATKHTSNSGILRVNKSSGSFFRSISCSQTGVCYQHEVENSLFWTWLEIACCNPEEWKTNINAIFVVNTFPNLELKKCCLGNKRDVFRCLLKHRSQ